MRRLLCSRFFVTTAILVLLAVWALGNVGTPGSLAGASYKAYLPIVRRVFPPYPATPLLLPIDNADGDGDYTVSWGPSERAESYEVEEQWQGGDWFQAYEGPAAQVPLANRPPGTYWYRCRARNSWGYSAWSNAQSTAVQGNAPGTISTPSSTSVKADGKSVVKVINDCPYPLRLEFTGPLPTVMQLPKCDVCKVYSFMGPFFCPAQNRPTEETRLDPGPYRVFVTVDDPSVRPYVGHWQLQGDRRYTVCFFIVRSYGQGEDSPTGQVVPGECR